MAKRLLFSCSVVPDSETPRITARQAPLSFTIPWLCSNSCPSSQWCHPALVLCCPLLFPSIRVFSSVSALCIRWPKYCCFSPSNGYSGFISFRIDWFDLLGVQGTLKNLLQHHSLKASIVWHSAFFMIQLSHLYMTTGKTITKQQTQKSRNPRRECYYPDWDQVSISATSQCKLRDEKWPKERTQRRKEPRLPIR